MYRGEVWLVNLDPTVGTEISKKRPCIIVNDNSIGILPLKVIVPVTDWKERYSIRPWMVKLEPTTENSLAKVSGVDTFQIRSVSETRLVRKLGQLSESEMQLISQALAVVLSLSLSN
ncbi:type II toxin-antitoxin system PemK/MazF family toxin [Anabaena cylindrica FACHB-243]|uniref:mRNA interferase n=1 Tax=Anabaena cylindrica (strain ATCC 27899 / PCC 7122) TaxID=272123 RepID=K9ZGE6_ANACC|nr:MULTISPECIES: type II toxin-antitoxin system PemK/MazF family toxin [Anabaena]AFZ58246.1 transcriptional modulator of MazE/toxin, MazF [Anabaena cylindrica PCC 7122]MBD2419894.1 type II toxin-antitoxin system PemK/MazF family toxin [Anabaena cylindrica FACHB-243]MBY5281020.1 type II toxin-antitoxin system PemK/MazF family toxin [Anabaena sp. CCAP 1446/1C]MBY5307329.1 type II toxin-antitoxin system PemK/MazF family toxin [Anabaena sp. CCAP 1446/1C]MCM2407904.1 type II toxin-antitoxin system 